jgi:hypothetical protein
MKLFTAHGDSELASWIAMSPTLVEMTAPICGGVVDTRPDGGGFTGRLTGSGTDRYWQSAPRSGGGANAGSGGAVADAGPLEPGLEPVLPGARARVWVEDAALSAEP